MKASTHSKSPRSTPEPIHTPEAAPAETSIEPSGEVIDLVPRVLGIHEILVPLDFSEPATKALHYAVAFARQCDARVSVVHVRPLPYYSGGLAGTPMVLPSDEPSIENVQAHLDKDVRRLIPQGMQHHAAVRVGSAHDEICAAARQFGTDLIIIATHGRTGLSRAFLGSTAEQVVRHAPCPVLIVREHEREFA
jgi:nucleotide-binding universal stress UspA family protein